MNPNLLLSRHLAVLGNTGSGKSCTIASFIQTILQNDEVVKGDGAHFVIFDTNGEYRAAFTGCTKFGALHIGQDDLMIPYWFMNLQDFRDLFRVTGGVQEPVLSTALSVSKQRALGARGDGGEAETADEFLVIVLREFEKIRADLNPENPKAEAYVGANVISNCDSLLGLCDKYSDEIAKIEKRLGGVKIKELSIGIKSLCPTKAYEKMTGTTKAEITKKVNPIIDKLTIALGTILGGGVSGDKLLDVDSPRYFDLTDFFERALPIAMKIQGGQSERIKEYCSTMLLRIRRLISDQRYGMLFQRNRDYPDALASFLRLCFGRMKNAKIEELGPLEKVDDHYFMKMYLAKHGQEPKKNYQVIILDLSLVPSDVLENVTALLGRLILEFMQRIEKAEIYKGEDVRGKFPVVLVLEEAHNYIPEMLPKDTESVSKQVFERIAREGRKYGLSLVVSSQRPSELSRTVLSQCNSFITHRIQNPEDQAYIKKLLPTISHGLLNQLPILAQGIALVFGDCVRAPMEVSVRMPNPEPKSDDPKFWEHWTNKYKEDEFQFENGEPDFEEVCRVWEGGKRKVSGESVYAGHQLGSPNVPKDPKPRRIPPVPKCPPRSSQEPEGNS